MEGLSLDGHFATAIAEFKKRLPLVHLVKAGNRSLRQAFIVGAKARETESDIDLYLDPRAIVCLESGRGRVHVYRADVPSNPINWRGLVELASFGDVWYAAQSEGDPEVLYSEGAHSWERSITLAPNASFTTKSGRGGRTGFIGDADCPLLDRKCAGHWVRGVLERHFAERYPDLAGGAELAVDRALPNAMLAMEGFYARLHPLVFDACERLHRGRARTYNALLHDDERILRHRYQAAYASPLLAWLATGHTDEAQKLQQVIDSRRPLIKEAARLFSVPAETVRFVSGVQLQRLYIPESVRATTSWGENADRLLAFLSRIPREHRPATPDDWQAFYSMLGEFEHWPLDCADAIAAFLQKAGRAGFANSAERLRRKARSRRPIEDCGDFLQSVEELANARGGTTTAFETLPTFVKMLGVRAILDLSIKWHRRFPGLASEALGPEAERDRLVCPVLSHYQYQGLSIVFLDSYGALVDEGLRMSHCVASLYGSCLRSETFAFSVRSEGESLATFDLSLDDEWLPSINQFRGPLNDDPPAHCVNAVEAFLRELKAAPVDHRGPFSEWQAQNSHRNDLPEMVNRHRLEEHARKRATSELLDDVPQFGWWVEALRRGGIE